MKSNKALTKQFAGVGLTTLKTGEKNKCLVTDGQKKYPLMSVETAISERYIDHLLLQQNLAFCIAHLESLIADYADEPHSLAAQSIMFQVIVRFIKCCGGGVSTVRVDPALYANYPDGGVYFDFIKNMRDGYLCHSVNVLEQCKVGVLVDPVTGASIGTAEYQQHYQLPVKAEANKLLDFIKIAFNEINKQTELAKADFKAEVNKLTPAQIAMLKPAELSNIHYTNFRKSRKKK